MMRLMEGKAATKFQPDKDLYPKKIIVRHGARHFLLDFKDIVYCYSNNKIAYIVDTSNTKYIADKNLMHLEEELDPRLFFKANRTHIINFNFIRSFVTHDKNKIKVELKTVDKEESVVVSQTRVTVFKRWVYQQL
ncbi:MAG: LytR/AlgR family response regulator transcription factor [Chitinophagaceae bacterium]